MTQKVGWRQRLRGEFPGLALLALSVLFTAVHAVPEVWIGRLPVNDAVFHLAASERLAQSVIRNEPFLNPWVSEWGLGYPIWTSYQPLPHILAAAVLQIFAAWGSAETIFACLGYLLLFTLPVSVYGGGRLWGLPPLAAGLASCLTFASSGAPPYGSYGLGYGAFVWRGSGLYTQLVALHVFGWALGSCRRALGGGRHAWFCLGSLGLGVTLLSHIIFGYVVYASVAVMAIFEEPRPTVVRLRRLVTLFLTSLLISIWFFMPLLLDRNIVNHSLWESPDKWDSYGATQILRDLARGNLWDSGRWPVLTAVVIVGWLCLLLYGRRTSQGRLLSALTLMWLMLFFGRFTWGNLVDLVGVPADLHMHRLQAPFEYFAFWGAALGLYTLWLSIANSNGFQPLLALGLIVLSFVYIFQDRSAYLAQNREWGEQNLSAYAREQADIDAVLAEIRRLLRKQPGRVDVGQARTYSALMKVGSVPFAAILARHHLDQVSFLYHSMSRAGDLIYFRNGSDAWQDDILGVRCVVAPASLRMTDHLKRTAVIGRFAVYEASGAGYWATTDLIGREEVNSRKDQSPALDWLSRLPSVFYGEGRTSTDPAEVEKLKFPVLYSYDHPEEIPGIVQQEEKVGESYRALVQMHRAGYILFKHTWNPNWKARVDARSAVSRPVVPGFSAVAVPPGLHSVEFSYDPGPLKLILFLTGALLWGMWASAPLLSSLRAKPFP